MKKLFYLIQSVLIINFISLNAQINLKQSVERAKEINYGIAASKKKLDAKKSEIGASKARYLPDVSVDFFYTHLGEDLILNLDPIRSVMIEMQSANQVGFSNVESMLKSGKPLSAEQQEAVKSAALSQLDKKLPHFQETIKEENFPQMMVNIKQPIFTGGKITAGVNAAKGKYEIEKIKVEKESNELALNVVNSYLAVLITNENVKVRTNVLEGITAHQYLAEKMLDAGLIQMHQKLRADVAKSEAERNLFEAQQRLYLAKYSLASLLDLDTTSIIIADSLKYRILNSNINEIISYLEQNNENIRQLKFANETMDAKIDAEFADFLPTIFGYGFYNVFDNYIAEIEPKWGVGIGAHLNIFDGLRKNHNLSEAKMEKEAISFTINETSRKLKLLANSQYIQMQIAGNSYQNSQKSVEMAIENLRLNEKRFESGLGTTLDVIDAQLVLEAIELNKAKTLYDYYSNMAQLYATAGILDKFIEFWQN